jgi:hypothetical protein
MTFSIQVRTDLFEPELPLGSYAVVDPDREPADDDIVLVRFNFSGRAMAPFLTAYRPFSGRDMEGRFCKRGDPQEKCVVSPVKISREQLSQGLVVILGTVIDWLPEPDPKRVMRSYRRPTTSMVAPAPC